jgi:shikimate dehydrogenase
MLSHEVARLRRDDCLGANVTIPHKEPVRSLLDATDPWADTVGAVNTIVKRGRDLIGYNTDTYGFLKSLKEKAGFDPRGKAVLMLGAGGAARAIVFGLAKERIASLTIANRSLERGQSLVDEVQGSLAGARAIPFDDALAAAAADADLIVNATPIGMEHGESRGRTPLPARLIPPGALVYDIVSVPSETPLMREARKAGAQALGGLSMLVYQGAESFRMWTGKEAPIDVMFRAGEKALEAGSQS